MTLPRKVAVSLIAAGSVLFGMYLEPTIYGAAMARLEISNFRAHKSQTVLWDRARTRAYRRTLHVALPAAGRPCCAFRGWVWKCRCSKAQATSR